MRYIAGFILSIILLILAFVLIFRGGNDSPTEVPNTAVQMVEFANTSTVVKYTLDYPVSADQTHRQIAITVGRDNATMDVYQGYEGQLLRSQTYPNNSTAYANFLRALQIAGYTIGSKDQELRDERGFCPTGYRYIYEIKEGQTSKQRYWSTSCSTEMGNFDGRAATIRDLFQRQIPDYSKLAANLRS